MRRARPNGRKLTTITTTARSGGAEQSDAEGKAGEHAGQRQQHEGADGDGRGSRRLVDALAGEAESAGSSVSAASIITSTLTALATAKPRTKASPMMNRPSNEIITVMPAKMTARPDESTACDHGVLRLHPVVEVLAVSGDDEQGVVDADAEPDHCRDLRRELGHAVRVGEDAEDAGADAETEQRRADRQAHRQHRAEGQQQDDHGGEDAEDLALGEREAGEHLAAVLDLQSWWTHDLVAERLDLVGQLDRRALAALGDAELGERDRLGACC